MHQDELQSLQLAIYRNAIDSNVGDCYRHFLESDGFIEAYSPQVLTRDGGGGPLDGGDAEDGGAPALGGGRTKQQLAVGQGALSLDAPWLSALRYLHAPESAVCSATGTKHDPCQSQLAARSQRPSSRTNLLRAPLTQRRMQGDIKAVTHWVVLPASPEAGRLTVLEAALFLGGKRGLTSRLALLPCVAPAPAHTALADVLLATAALAAESGGEALAFLTALASDTALWGTLAVQPTREGLDNSVLELAARAGLDTSSLRDAAAALQRGESSQVRRASR